MTSPDSAAPRKKGELRIYLGAAPGVGKTYAMLGEAHRRIGRGTDLVVGFVETHGREKTAKLLEDLEIVPRRTVDYRGSTSTEMDIDAVGRTPRASARRWPAEKGAGPTKTGGASS